MAPRLVALLVLLFASLSAGTPAAAADRDALSLRRALELRGENRLPEAAAVLDSLRARHPDDARTGRLYAETLAWEGKLRRATSVYAGLAARGDSLSLLGLALAHAWSGDLARSASEYRNLARSPRLREPALIGLSRVRYWQGRYAESGDLLVEARRLGPIGPDGGRLARDLAIETAPLALARGRYQDDSDHNHYDLTQAGASGMLVRDLRWEALLGLGSVSRAAAVYRLARGELGVDGALGGIWSGAARGGVEHRSGTGGTDRGFASARLKADVGRWRASVSAESGHLSDTPALIAADVGSTTAGADASWIPCDRFEADAGGAVASFTDDNTRPSVYASVRGRLPGGGLIPSLSLVHRAFRDDPGGPRVYFAPRTYRSDEAELSIAERLWQRRLSYSLRAALGAQKIADQPVDTIFGITLALDYAPRPDLRLSLGASRSNSAAQSASGYTFDSLTLGAMIRF